MFYHLNLLQQDFPKFYHKQSTGKYQNSAGNFASLKHCASNIIQSIEVRKLGELQTKILEILKKR